MKNNYVKNRFDYLALLKSKDYFATDPKLITFLDIFDIYRLFSENGSFNGMNFNFINDVEFNESLQQDAYVRDEYTSNQKLLLTEYFIKLNQALKNLTVNNIKGNSNFLNKGYFQIVSKTVNIGGTDFKIPRLYVNKALESEYFNDSLYISTDEITVGDQKTYLFDLLFPLVDNLRLFNASYVKDNIQLNEYYSIDDEDELYNIGPCKIFTVLSILYYLASTYYHKMAILGKNSNDINGLIFNFPDSLEASYDTLSFMDIFKYIFPFIIRTTSSDIDGNVLVVQVNDVSNYLGVNTLQTEIGNIFNEYRVIFNSNDPDIITNTFDYYIEDYTMTHNRMRRIFNDNVNILGNLYGQYDEITPETFIVDYGYSDPSHFMDYTESGIDLTVDHDDFMIIMRVVGGSTIEIEADGASFGLYSFIGFDASGNINNSISMDNASFTPGSTNAVCIDGNGKIFKVATTGVIVLLPDQEGAFTPWNLHSINIKSEYGRNILSGIPKTINENDFISIPYEGNGLMFQKPQFDDESYIAIQSMNDNSENFDEDYLDNIINYLPDDSLNSVGHVILPNNNCLRVQNNSLLNYYIEKFNKFITCHCEARNNMISNTIELYNISQDEDIIEIGINDASNPLSLLFSAGSVNDSSIYHELSRDLNIYSGAISFVNSSLKMVAAQSNLKLPTLQQMYYDLGGSYLSSRNLAKAVVNVEKFNDSNGVKLELSSFIIDYLSVIYNDDNIDNIIPRSHVINELYCDNIVVPGLVSSDLYKPIDCNIEELISISSYLIYKCFLDNDSIKELVMTKISKLSPTILMGVMSTFRNEVSNNIEVILACMNDVLTSDIIYSQTCVDLSDFSQKFLDIKDRLNLSSVYGDLVNCMIIDSEGNNRIISNSADQVINDATNMLNSNELLDIVEFHLISECDLRTLIHQYDLEFMLHPIFSLTQTGEIDTISYSSSSIDRGIYDMTLTSEGYKLGDLLLQYLLALNTDNSIDNLDELNFYEIELTNTKNALLSLYKDINVTNITEQLLDYSDSIESVDLSSNLNAIDSQTEVYISSIKIEDGGEGNLMQQCSSVLADAAYKAASISKSTLTTLSEGSNIDKNGTNTKIKVFVDSISNESLTAFDQIKNVLGISLTSDANAITGWSDSDSITAASNLALALNVSIDLTGVAQIFNTVGKVIKSGINYFVKWTTGQFKDVVYDGISYSIKKNGIEAVDIPTYQTLLTADQLTTMFPSFSQTVIHYLKNESKLMTSLQFQFMNHIGFIQYMGQDNYLLSYTPYIDPVEINKLSLESDYDLLMAIYSSYRTSLLVHNRIITQIKLSQLWIDLMGGDNYEFCIGTFSDNFKRLNIIPKEKVIKLAFDGVKKYKCDQNSANTAVILGTVGMIAGVALCCTGVGAAVGVGVIALSIGATAAIAGTVAYSTSEYVPTVEEIIETAEIDPDFGNKYISTSDLLMMLSFFPSSLYSMMNFLLEQLHAEGYVHSGQGLLLNDRFIPLMYSEGPINFKYHIYSDSERAITTRVKLATAILVTAATVIALRLSTRQLRIRKKYNKHTKLLWMVSKPSATKIVDGVEVLNPNWSREMSNYKRLISKSIRKTTRLGLLLSNSVPAIGSAICTSVGDNSMDSLNDTLNEINDTQSSKMERIILTTDEVKDSNEEIKDSQSTTGDLISGVGSAVSILRTAVSKLNESVEESQASNEDLAF